MPDARTPIERAIVGALESREELDHELIWLGYAHNYEPEDVTKALQRLRRRGIIACPNKRGWYVLALGEKRGLEDRP